MPEINVSGLLRGLSWNGFEQPVYGQAATITYTILESVPSYYGSPGGLGYPANFSPLTSEQVGAVLAALQSWANVANITLVPVTQNESSVGQITFGRRGDLGNTAATGQYPVANPEGGDVWLNSSFPEPLPGDYYYATIIHEIGHALGLKHPIFYSGDTAENNPSPYYSGDYQGKANELYTVMAYGANPYDSAWHASRPMLYDIQAIQYLYGANNNYRTGNDSYAYSPTGAITYEAIWDAGGVDEINAALFSAPVVINLRAGEYNTAIGPSNLAQFNIAIAPGAVIENAIGGSGNDVLIGNQVSNRLEGNAGSDILDGGVATNAGTGSIPKGQGDGVSDTLVGGAGFDTYILREGGGVDHIVDSGANRIIFRNAQDADVEIAGQVLFVDTQDPTTGRNATGTITYTQNSPLTLTHTTTGTQVVIDGFAEGDFGINLREVRDAHEYAEPGAAMTGGNDADSLVGTAGADLIQGFGGHDTLEGGAGDDIVEGGDGDDVIHGEAGFDRLYGGAGDDWMDGGADDDDLYGGAGHDILQGGAGYDRLAREANFPRFRTRRVNGGMQAVACM